jgi:hypothetical protein
MLRLARRVVFMPLVALLCIGAAVLWRRSYGDVDLLIGVGPTAKLNAAGSYRGKLVFFSSSVPFDPGKQWSLQPVRAPLEEVQPLYEGLFEQGTTLRASLIGFQLGHGTIDVFKDPPAFTAVTVPHWFVVLMTAVPTVLWMRGGVRRWRWGRHGRCRDCGYDLRSSPERCPECGAVPRKALPRAPAAVAAALVLAVVVVAPAARAGDWQNVVVPDLDLSNATLGQALDKIGVLSGQNFVVRWPALKAVGLSRDTPVRLHLWDVRVGPSLRLVLDLVCGGTVLGWDDVDGVITVSTSEDLARETVTQVYDVRDLLAAMNLSQVPGLPEEGRVWQELVDELTRLITETIEADSWRDAGGSVGSLRELGGRLIVTQTPENHKQLRALLVRLREEFARPMPVIKPVAATAPADGETLVGDVRIYDVRDLLRAMVASDAEWSGEPHTPFEIEAQLVGAVVENVEPDSWDVRPNRQEASGNGNSISTIGGRLLVRQSPEVHVLLQRYLSEMRAQFVTRGGGPATSRSAPTRPARRRAGGRSQSSPGSLFAAPPPAR